MHLPLPRTVRPPRPRLPRPTARLRLTVLCAALYLVCATALVGVTYLLLARTFGAGYGTAVRVPATLDPPQTQAQLLALLLRELLIRFGIALGIVGVAALGLGWLAAGRILRPLATINATARRICAASLDERMDLAGPDDELKALGDTLDALFARLQASFEAQRHFVANASHELRTPLTADRTLLQIALEDPAPTCGMWRAAGEELLASNAEQERLIEALLTLAGSESGIEHHEPVDLAAVTDAVLLTPRPERHRLDLHVETATKPALLYGDPVLTEQLVANLVDNAFRHNIPGGRIQVTTDTVRGRAVLSVASTGPLVPPAEIDRLFEPFQRLHARRTRGGTGNHVGHGLGLSIVRAIADAHGATINARTQPGGGLDIDIAFPAPGHPADRRAQPSTTGCEQKPR